MEAMRQSWTDDRLDEFRGEVAASFDRVDRRFEQVDDRFDRMDERFDVVNGRIKELAGRMDRLDERMGGLEAKFSSWERTILQLGIGMIVTFVVGFASLIVTLVVTQL